MMNGIFRQETICVMASEAEDRKSEGVHSRCDSDESNSTMKMNHIQSIKTEFTERLKWSCAPREIAYSKKEEREEVGEEKMVAAQRKYTPATVGGVFPPPVMKVVVVGYALTSKKIKSFLQPKFERLARNKGILFVPIDQSRPLSDQGPFDIVLHKLSGKEWRRVLEIVPAGGLLERTSRSHGTFDPPNAIQQVHNRQSMLQDVADLNLSDLYGKVGVPKQLVIKKDPSSIPGAVNKAGLRLPIVAKPFGFAKLHELSLAYDEFSLQKLEPPLVLQEFINHGGVLFKVYIVGEAIKVVRRFSLPDVSKRELSKNAGVYRFRVSCASASADEADLDPCVAELPPRPLLERLAKELRRRLVHLLSAVNFGCSLAWIWKNARIRAYIYRFPSEPGPKQIERAKTTGEIGSANLAMYHHASLMEGKVYENVRLHMLATLFQRQN
ncbi:hypothetical protein DH2020_008323 [Rehmannia glutinosa]|uniref:Inositol-tetrakisphosphate 1-kinase n=1 Tax=Rehmannia glutinosa TaxID=99300 RepID=A0ABR0U148_REHGL